MKKILIIEDDRKLLELRLKMNGYEVLTVSDEREASAKAKEYKPDLIMLNVLIPIVDHCSQLQQLLFEDIKKVIALNPSC